MNKLQVWMVEHFHYTWNYVLHATDLDTLLSQVLVQYVLQKCELARDSVHHHVYRRDIVFCITRE